MKIDKNLIETALYGSTLNKSQCAIIGQPYPLNDNWKDLVIGEEISTANINLFILLRGKLSLTVQKQIIKNYNLLSEFHNPKEKTEKIEKKNISHSSQLKIYCDGACKGNPGISGSGIAVYENNSVTLWYGEYIEKGTNNTAELNALYQSLLIASKSQSSKITIYSDSKYSIDSITKWAYGWKKIGWKRKGGDIKNLELIKTIHYLYDNIKDKIRVKYVKGHSGVEGNELADRMAVMAIKNRNSEYKIYKFKSIDEVLKY